MNAILVKLFKIMLVKLLTETFCFKLIVDLADYFAQKTTNKLDDKMVANLAKALGVTYNK